MKIKILCLGRLNKDEENELCKRYESRLKTLKKSGITSFGIDHISKKELENIIIAIEAINRVNLMIVLIFLFKAMRLNPLRMIAFAAACLRKQAAVYALGYRWLLIPRCL